MSVKRISTFATRAVIASARPARFQASSLLNTSPKLRTTIQRPATTCHVQHRFHSTEGKPNNKVWDFDSIKQLTEQPSTDHVLIGTLSTLSSCLLPISRTHLFSSLSSSSDLTPYHRRPRTHRIRSRLHPHRHQHPRRLRSRRPLHARPRVRRQIRV